MVYCFAFGCNHQSLREHCKFFRFPLKDEAILGQWKSACRRVDRDPNQYDRLCSCHFKDCKKENGPTIFNGEEAPGESEDAKVKPKVEPVDPPPPPPVQAKPGPAASVSMRRKRMRFEYVSYGVQNGKLKRMGSTPSTASKGVGHLTTRRKTKPVFNRTVAPATTIKPSPPPSPSLVNESCSNRAPMTKDQIRWLRMIDRIRCLAFREARDAGASFISVRWVADCLNRSAAFVKKHWRGRYQDCVPPTVLPGHTEPPSSVAEVAAVEMERKAMNTTPPPLTLGAVPAAKLQQQRESTGEEAEVEALHDDWDPIMEERKVIEGLLVDEEMNGADHNDITAPLSLDVAQEGGAFIHNLAMHPDDPGAVSPGRRRAQPRDKVTPRTRTEALVERNEEEENAPLKCGQCGRKFSTAANLERHIRLHGISVGPFVCPQCGSVFAKRRGLVRHLRVHGGEPRYACETCGKGFAQRTNLEKHRRLHTGERAYGCRLCDRKFMEQEHLTSHMLQHSGERPYSCDFCDKRFKMQCHLVSHLRSHVPPLLASKNANP